MAGVSSAHSFTMGTAWTQYTVWINNQTLLPTAAFGVVATDPAAAMFNPDNFPNASGAQLTAAQNIGNATFRANAARAGLPANFFIANPTRWPAPT